MKIIVSGGTGFIGQELVTKLLHQGHHIILLSRNPKAGKKFGNAAVESCLWDAENVSSWATQFEKADAVINLAGETIATRWSKKQKEKIIESRINSTRSIVNALSQAKTKPNVLINASAIGYYGNVPEGELREDAVRGSGFLAETCERWEDEARKAEAVGVRVVLPRFGIVLEKGGGALPKFLAPFRFFIGGPLGSGKQWLSWVHREDLVLLLLFLLSEPDVNGPVNVTAPNPVRMKEFCRCLGKVTGRPSWAPVPSIVLKLLLGEMADEMLLSGQKVIPDKAMKEGFQFKYPDLEGALTGILKKS